jgi:IclR family mhp operon transcriptional activator
MIGSAGTIRTAVRVLQVLAALNADHPAGAAQVARRLKMSRATTYRFLETLVAAGYASKDEGTGQYSPSYRVRELSCGFEDEQWVTTVARPVIHELGNELMWPIAISTISGPGMLLRESTDMESPLAVNRFGPGRRIGLLDTASGLTYLAFCGREQRETLLDVLTARSDLPEGDSIDRARVRRELLTIRERGYALMRRPQRITPQCAIAVPVFASSRILASLSIRYSDSAVKESTALQRFLPQLQRAAARIGTEFEAAVAR